MPSRTIRPTEAPAAAPFAYTVGTADGLAPQAVTAQWDGSGAGGDFLPCVSFYNAEGVLLDRAFPDGVTMHAGDTAEVSYRPFRRGGSASTPPPPVFVPAVARAHVTGIQYTVPSNNHQVPISVDFLQDVSFSLNQFEIDVGGWYLVFGTLGWIRRGPSGARDRVVWTMTPSGGAEVGISLETIEAALTAAQFVEGTTSIASPLFLQAADNVRVIASITDQFGAQSALGSLEVGGLFGLFQLA